jgi:excisionase family DNA binding protein
MVKIGKLLDLGARKSLRDPTIEAIRANRSDVRFGRETSRTIAIRQTACGGQSADRTRTGLAAGEGLDVPMKTVFTTGEAAKICKVSQQTIIRCFDNGQLKGFRVPGSRFRRIPRDMLYKFMKDNGIPTDALESGKRKVLLVDDDVELVELMSKVLEEDGRFEIRVANTGFDAGMLVKEYRPDMIVLDVMLPDINGKEVCHRVRGDNTLEDVRILCISGMVEDDKIADLKLSGADDFLHKPFEIEQLIDRICHLLEIEQMSEAV